MIYSDFKIITYKVINIINVLLECKKDLFYYGVTIFEL
jgi:hypothetical protein